MPEITSLARRKRRNCTVVFASAGANLRNPATVCSRLHGQVAVAGGCFWHDLKPVKWGFADMLCLRDRVLAAPLALLGLSGTQALCCVYVRSAYV
jgi:hypothetical protein